MKPILHFRVFTHTKGDQAKMSPYFWCSVWRTKKQAQSRMVQLQEGRPLAGDPAGACYSWTRLRQDADQRAVAIHREMGEIVLCLKYSGSSTIYHECGHAAKRLIERLQQYPDFHLPDTESEEERLCLTIGWMGRQVVKRLVAYDKRVKSSTHHLRLLALFLWLRKISQ